MGHGSRDQRLFTAACLGVLGVAVVLLAAGAPAAAAVVALAGGAAAIARPWLVDNDQRTDDELVSHVSHELRTPLTSIIGILDLLSADRAELDPDEASELLGMAQVEAEHMRHLVNNIHTASRLARDILDPTRSPIDLVDLAGRVIDRFPDVGRRTYVPKGEVIASWGDARLATQIITNLVQNASRYAPDGEIEIGIEQRDHQVALSVSDDGPGISPTEHDRLFEASGPSHRGLGIGLSLSRQLARKMGGDLILDRSVRRGATFSLLLPYADEAPDRLPSVSTRSGGGALALSPRARVLVDMAAALSERSLDRTVAGLRKLYVELLNAAGGMLLVPAGHETFRPAGSFGVHSETSESFADPVLSQVMRTSQPVVVEELATASNGVWHDVLGGESAVFHPVLDLGEPVGVLAISWADPSGLPGPQESAVANALAQIAAFSIHRSNLADDVAYERGLRASVMESLPIAISVFAGDPPRVVDWNRRERRMLGIEDDAERPTDLDESQHKFEVRFADGTPLTVENAPVTAAIRTGRSMGPFLLVVRRADGTDVTTRTYCAPFFDERGKVAGAVVTSEPLDVAAPTGAVHEGDPAPAGR